MSTASLYIHIPFCHSKCIYCDFFSNAGTKHSEAIVQGIVREFHARKDEIPRQIDTVYIGGGTPSCIDNSLVEYLFCNLPLDKATEITIEANPEDISFEKAELWESLGINRVSMGVQTFNDDVLRRLGRRHTGIQACKAVDILLNKGISNISIDLIYGLPGISQAEWEQDLNTAFSLPIKHLSAYSLTYTEGTMLWKLKEKGKVEAISDEETAARYDALEEKASKAGFEHYEISNFALPGYRSRHNSGYWDPRHVWLGLGPSAHSFDGTMRRADIADNASWLAALPLPFETEAESAIDLENDLLVACLRTSDGLDLSALSEPTRRYVHEKATPFIDAGHMSIHDSTYLRIESNQWLRSDYFIRNLLRLE